MSPTGSGAYSAYMSGNQAGRSGLIGPSGVTGCYRQHAFKYLGVEHTDVVPVGAADLGTLLHLGWTTIIKGTFTPEDRDADVLIDWGGPRPGSADDVDYAHRIVSDLKSVSARNLQYWLNNGVSGSYWDQLTCYAHGLTAMYGGDWEMRIIALPLEDGDGFQRGVPVEFTMPYDPQHGAELVALANERHAALMDVRSLLGVVTDDALSLVEQFPREGKGPGRFPCDWCPFVSACWPDARDGMSPQSETVVDDPEAVGRWASQYMAASAEESAAKRRKSEASAFLRGIGGTFPTPDGARVKVTVVGGSAKRVPDMDAIREQWRGDLPMKEQRSASYPRVTRLR